MDFIQKHRKDFLVFTVIAIVYFALRLPNLTLQPIFADEAIYIRWAQVMKAEPTLRFVSLADGKTPLFMWAMAPLFKVIQDPLLAGRFLSVLSGFITLTGVFFLSKKVFGRSVSFWAALIYTVCPYTVFFDRMALVDSMLAAFTIWSIYFAIWLLKAVRLDLAMMLGYLLGGALLVKTPAMVNLLILPLSIIGIKKNFPRPRFLKLVALWGVAIIIALIMYNLLRLGPGFQQLSARNADYVFHPFELIGRPLDPFIPHLRDLSDWFPKLFTTPILIMMGLGIALSLITLNRLALVVLIWAVIPLLFEMAFLRTFTARYLLSAIAPLLMFAAFGITRILTRIRINNSLKLAVTLLAILPLALKFDLQLVTSPPPDDLPSEEKRGYFEDWTAGYGFEQIANYILEQGKGKRVVVGTEGFFGTLPDGLQIYLDKANVAIVGSPATISAQIRNAAKENLTYFVGNKKNLEGSIRDVILIKEYPKLKPLGNLPQDSTVLYQVLP